MWTPVLLLFFQIPAIPIPPSIPDLKVEDMIFEFFAITYSSRKIMLTIMPEKF